MNFNLQKTIPDIIAAIVLFTFIGYIGLAITGLVGTTLGAVSAGWMALYATIVLMSAVKLYGKKTLEAVRNAGTKIAQVNEVTTRDKQQ